MVAVAVNALTRQFVVFPARSDARVELTRLGLAAGEWEVIDDEHHGVVSAAALITTRACNEEWGEYSIRVFDPEGGPERG